jgi:predicted nucleotidyltransferase
MSDKLKINIKALQTLLKKERSIVAVYLFGSYSKGNHTKSSDIDIGVLCDNKSDLDILALSLKIGGLINPKLTDVTIVDTKSQPLLLSEIINGKVIYENSVDKRVKSESEILRLVEDFKHLQNIKTYYLNQSFREGLYANQ